MVRPTESEESGTADGWVWRPSFDQLLQAERMRRRPGVKPESLAEYAHLRSRYEAANGTILDFCVCKNVDGAGSILTSKNEIWVRYPANDIVASHPGLEDALWRANALAREGHQLLTGPRGAVLASMVQSVFVYLLGILDSLHRPQPADDPCGQSAERIQKSLVTAGKELDRIATYLRRSTQAVSQKDYLLGMLLGLLGLPLLALGLGMMHIGDADTAQLPPFVLVVGGAGAVVSVMTRISSGKLILDPHASRGMLALGGVVRPVIGAVMALVVYVVIQSGLVPMEVPDGTQDATYLFVTLAFLAGFSERFAQDMLSRASSLAMPGEGEAPADSSPPKATLPRPVEQLGTAPRT